MHGALEVDSMSQCRRLIS